VEKAASNPVAQQWSAIQQSSRAGLKKRLPFQKVKTLFKFPFGNRQLKDGRGGEIRTRSGTFQQTIENKGTPIDSMVSMALRVFVKMQQNEAKSFSDDRKR
jgi:hypothetical protein